VAAPITDRLPLIVGIAAHRRLHEQGAAMLAALERQLRSIIARLKQDYLDIDTPTNIGRTPVIVVSNLVGKAHRIAESAAWSNGAGVVSPFTGVAAEAESLLKADPERDREGCIFVARYCDVLIVIGDGTGDDQEDGSPAQILAMRRRGIPLPIAATARACIDAAEIGPVIEIRVPAPGGSPDDIRVLPWGLEFMARHEESRLQRTRRDAANVGRHLLGRFAEQAVLGASDEDEQTFDSWKTFAGLVMLTKEFNVDAAGLSFTADGAAKMAEGLEWLFGIDTDPARGRPAFAGAMQLVPRWCRLYAIADTLAQRWQKRFWTDWTCLFVLAFGAILCFEVFAHLAHWLPHSLPLEEGPARAAASVAIDITLLGGYVGVLLGGYFFYRAAVKRGHQERFLDYRALAEALRVAIYWQLMGVGEESGGAVPSVADAYPIRQPSELAWVKTCLLTLEFLDHAEKTGAARPAEPTAYFWLRDLWVKGQHGYFKKSAHRNDEYAAVHEERWFAFLFGSIGFAIALILAKRGMMGVDAGYFRDHQVLHDVAIFFIGVLPAVAAAFLGYSEKLAYKAQARQYDRMRSVFAQALTHLPEKLPSGDCSRFKRLFYYLGVEAMREQADWVAIYRQRPIQPL
jgi:hypothetical protein